MYAEGTRARLRRDVLAICLTTSRASLSRLGMSKVFRSYVNTPATCESRAEPPLLGGPSRSPSIVKPSPHALARPLYDVPKGRVCTQGHDDMFGGAVRAESEPYASFRFCGRPSAHVAGSDVRGLAHARTRRTAGDPMFSGDGRPRGRPNPQVGPDVPRVSARDAKTGQSWKLRRPSARSGPGTVSKDRNVRSKCRCSCVLQFTS